VNDRQVILNIEQVVVPKRRLRGVDPERVSEIALSMADAGGQITPIEVMATDEPGVFLLVSGAHRVAALRRNGEAEVMAVVFDGDPVTIRKREIDENLFRHELTPYDRAAFLKERAEIWRREHGETKGRPKNGANLAPSSLYRDIEEKFGLPKRTAIRSIGLRDGICDEVWEMLREHPVRRNQTDLAALARLRSAPDLQKRIAELLVSRGMTSVSAAKRVLGIGAEPSDPVDAVSRAFTNLTPARQRAFVKRNFETLTAIMKKGDFL
jgi:uncharacterized ParB-like nuclease family protein